MTDHRGDPFPDLDPDRIVDIDVREDFEQGRPPLPRVLRAVGGLAPGAVLHVRSPFRPGPLIERLAGDGFRWHSEAFAADDWSSWFWMPGEVAPRTPRPIEPAGPAPDGVLDLRGLSPPEPMLRVLERAETHPGPFDVLVPFFPGPLVGMLRPLGRAVTLLESRSDGVVIRIEAASR